MGANNVTPSSQGYQHDNITIYYNTDGYGYSNHVLTVNYYDNYPSTSSSNPVTVLGHSIASGDITKGLPTHSITREIGTWNFMYNTTYYENKYLRPVHTYNKNLLGGHIIVNSKLDFRGKVLNTETTHRQTNSSAVILVKEAFYYYPNELLKYQTHQVNNDAIEYINQNSYNEINQLVNKKVGNTTLSTPLQSVDYKYNIRGWMTDINNIDVTETGIYKDLFSYRINYDQLNYYPHEGSFGINYYNGNITNLKWKTAKDNVVRTYYYSYDNLNRLVLANYLKGSESAIGAFNESARYDKNGNILKIARNGNQDTSNNPIEIDNLTYDYTTNSNKLINVTDSKINSGFDDGNKHLTTSKNDYAYDVNGNITQDLNKGITKIIYNHLNLPTEVLWNDNKKINYTYDTNGTKLRKIVKDGTQITTTEYIAGFQYINNVLQFFPTAEGYVNVTNGTTFNYVYNFTDHVNNVRLSYQKVSNGTLKIIEENNYYPFGLQHNRCASGLCLTEGEVSLDIVGFQNYYYKFGGKEKQTEFNINLFDFGARNYDPAIARWMNIDPLAEKMRRHSPYNYAFNNPVFFTDPDGMQPEITLYNHGDGIGISFDDGMMSFGGSTNDPNNPKNLILNITTDAFGKFDKKDWANNGWKVVDISTTSEALKDVKDKTFDNIIFVSHGGTLAVDGVKSAYGIFLNPTKNDDTWNDLTNWLWSTDIVEYKQTGTLAKEERKQDIENFVSIGKTVNNGKNFVFMGCNIAFGGNIIADYLSDRIGNKVDVWMSRDLVNTYGDKKTGLLMTDHESYKNKKEVNFNRNLIIPENYNGGWIKSTNGVSTNIKNLQLNQYGIKVVK